MRWHGRVTIDHIVGVQKFHTIPTPRVGGLAIGIALLGFMLFFGGLYNPLCVFTIISGIPLVASGLIEDLTKNVRPRTRLCFSMVSGLIFVLWSGYRVEDIQFPLINYLFSVPILSILLTSFALAGIANGINLIDGYHGLACGSVAIMFGALALLSYRVNDPMLTTFALAHLAVTIGFMGVNFPSGRLFLGDGGAYYLGFALGTNVIMLFLRNGDVSPWTAVIVLTYPLIETLFSIFRKWNTAGHSPGKPDRIHFHHLLYRSVVKPKMKALGKRQYANPLTGLFMWILPLLCGIGAQIGLGSVAGSVLIFFGLIAFYLTCYGLLSYYAYNRKKLK